MVPGSLARLFRPRTIKQKLLLVAGIAAVPSAILLAVVLNSQRSDSSTAQLEKDGIQYVLPLDKLLQDMQIYRGITAAKLENTPGFDAKQVDQKAAVEADFTAALAQDKKFGSEFHVQRRLADTHQAWGNLYTSLADATPRESVDKYTALITTQVVPLVYDVSENSGLLRDPQSASYHSAVVLGSSLPAITENMGELRGYSVVFMADGVKLLAADRDFLNGLIGRANENSLVFDRELRAAAAADKKFLAPATPLIQAADDGTQRLIADVQNNLLTPPIAQGDVATFYANATVSINETFQVSGATSTNLVRQLNARVSGATRTIEVSLAVAGAGLVVVALLILATIFSITGRVSHLVKAADRISLGELDAEVDVAGKDELGELAESLGRMRSSLQSAIERLRTRRAS